MPKFIQNAQMHTRHHAKTPQFIRNAELYTKRRNLHKTPKFTQHIKQVKKQELEAEHEDRLRLETVSHLCRHLIQLYIPYYMKKKMYKNSKNVKNVEILYEMPKMYPRYHATTTKFCR